MSKTIIGSLFILAGLIYSGLAFDKFYAPTLGWLVENKWVKPASTGKNDLKAILGRKSAILVYAGILIIIGIFILWNRNN